MAATKDQERKALEKIRKIVEELGEDSYIGMAFEGCFEDAEENIENDFGLSWKDRAEKARKTIEELNGRVESLLSETNRQSEELAEYQRKSLDKAEIMAIREAISRDYNRQQELASKAAADIVEFAEKPESDLFAQAVDNHRRAARRADLDHEILANMSKKFSS